MSLNFDQVKRGPGYWHFNNDLLSNAAFESQIQDFWDSWKTKFEDFENPLLWSDKAKCHFKRITIRSMKIIGKQNRQERFLLESICVFTKDNLDTASEPIDLLKETLKFCKALFTAQTCDAHARNEFLNCTIPKLSDDVCLITEEELSKAVKAMECNKSPGCDGLMTNFYKHFWPTLGESITLVYNYAFENGFLTVSQRRGISTLLFKKRRLHASKELAARNFT